MNRVRTWVGVAVLSSIRSSPSAFLSPPRFTDVYVSGDAGYHTFRIRRSSPHRTARCSRSLSAASRRQ